MKRVIVDTDDVIRDFVPQLLKVYKKYYPDHNIPKIDDINSWRLSQFFPIGDKIYEFFAEEHIVETFYESSPKAEAIKFLNRLKKIKGIHIILATSQHSLECKAITMQWYLKHNIPHDSIYFAEDKSEIKADYLIDDSPNQLSRALYKKIHIIPFTQPWNIDWQLRYMADGEEKERLKSERLNMTDEEKFEKIYNIIIKDKE